MVNIHKVADSKALLFIMLFWLLTGCISYSHRGLVGVDSLPDKSLIGISYKDLIIRYGMPDRITPFNQADPVNMGIPGEFSSFPDNKKSGDFMANYSFISSYEVLLYYRDRGYTYTILIKDGKVSSLTSLLTSKSDGIGFRNSMGMGTVGLMAGFEK